MKPEEITSHHPINIQEVIKSRNESEITEDLASLEKTIAGLTDRIKDGTLKTCIIIYNFNHEDTSKISYNWLGTDSISDILGILEFAKQMIWMQNATTAQPENENE